MSIVKLGPPDDPNGLRGRNALVLGLGSRQGGVGVARYLCNAGARVRVTDLRGADELAGPLADLADLPIEYTLGGHAETDVAWADVVMRNPAVPRESPWLALARRLGKRVEMEMSLFLRACPAPVLGVTGTKGKTTTTTLAHRMLLERWPAAVLAGNMGRSALAELGSLDQTTPVALEVSSFQAESLDEHGLSPHVAVITNLSEDHLDRYPSFAEYALVKARFAAHQQAGDWLVVPNAEPIEELTAGFAGRRVIAGGRQGAETHALWIENERFVARWDDVLLDLGPTDALRLLGAHSQLNALTAAGAALALGVTPDEIQRGIASFRGVPHRLEHVAVVDGVEYVNDTAATAPAAAIAALDAFARRDLVVIAGGSDKRLPLGAFANALARVARSVVLLDGAATTTLRSQLAERGFDAIDGPFGSMAAAVEVAASAAADGTVVLLSPGCASFGLFRDEFHRGEAFRAAVAELAARRDTKAGTR